MRGSLQSQRKITPKFIKPNIKFHGTENPHHRTRSFLSAIILKGIDKDIFHIIFPSKFDKDAMKWYNIVDPQKVTNWDDLCKEFLH